MIVLSVLFECQEKTVTVMFLSLSGCGVKCFLGKMSRGLIVDVINGIKKNLIQKNSEVFIRNLIPYAFAKEKINVMLLEICSPIKWQFWNDLSMLLKENKFCVLKSRFNSRAEWVNAEANSS